MQTHTHTPSFLTTLPGNYSEWKTLCHTFIINSRLHPWEPSITHPCHGNTHVIITPSVPMSSFWSINSVKGFSFVLFFISGSCVTLWWHNSEHEETENRMSGFNLELDCGPAERDNIKPEELQEEDESKDKKQLLSNKSFSQSRHRCYLQH